MTLSFGYSPCPNDTFAFHAATEGLVGDVEFDVDLHDVETLNERAMDGELDVTKLSFGAFAYVVDEYSLLRSGGALAEGVGPIVVADDDIDVNRLADQDVEVVIPGELTTAHLLLQLRTPEFEAANALRFDEIMPAVTDGSFDAGLVIHEGRFTYRDYGLQQVVDLGEWWEEETDTPVPLGCVAVHRDVDDPAKVEEALRQSVEHAFEHPMESSDYVRGHAQEMEEDVLERHVDTYVNDYTVDFGEDGLQAVEELFRRGREIDLLPDNDADILAT